MVQDTLVGVLGAVLIVGSMVAAIDYQEAGADGDGEVTDAPPPIGQSTWKASSCEAGSLYWTPSLSDLDDVVGPHHTPQEGPLPDRGLFWLFVFDCKRSSVDGLSVSPPSGATALVAVEEPDDTRNVTAPDGWAAVPAQYGNPDSRIGEIFDAHGFTFTSAQAAVGSTSTPLNDQVRVTLDTPSGYFEASMTVTGPTTERTVDGALVGTSEDTFSVFSGEERMDRRSNGTATIDTRGTTWVERLNLDPTPYQITYDSGMSWDFTFQHEPWETNETDEETMQRSHSPREDPSTAELTPSLWAAELAR